MKRKERILKEIRESLLDLVLFLGAVYGVISVLVIFKVIAHMI